MALKDLAADLENFKYGISSPDRIDGQIESGVDFFDDTTGGARGFTPKTDLESLYNQVQNATFGPVGGGVDTYADLNPITPFQSIFQLDQNGFPVQPGEDNPLITLNIDNNVLNTVPQLPNAFGSDFMTTPLEGYVSRLPNDVFNNPPNTSLYSQTFTVDVDTNLFSQQNNFLSPNVPNAFGSDFMTTPIGGAFSRIDDRNTLTSTVGDETFNDNPRIPNAAGSDFMTTPILDRLTSFSNPSDSLTLTIEKPNQPTETFSDDPRIPNARRIGNTISPLADIVGINTGISSFPASNPDISSPGITFDGIDPAFDPNEQRLKQRGYFDTYVNTEFNNKLLENRYFTELGTSIHISPNEEIQAGLGYGAGVGQIFTLFEPNSSLIDSETVNIPSAVNIFPIEGRQSQYSIGEDFTPSQTWTIGGGDLNNGSLTPDTPPRETNLTSPTPYGLGRSRYDAIRNDGDNILDELKNTVDGFKNDIDGLYEFADGQFSNVPAGLGTDNLFGTDNYRTVANKGPFTGKDNHPLILREIGNNWGKNPPEEPGAIPSFFNALGSSIFRGAPGITGLIDRNLTDKVRLFKYMALTPQGLAFTTKQFALQLLNPDKGTIIYNPASTLGIAGATDILDGNVGGLLKAAVSAVLPISHVERHLGGYRYGEAVKSTGQIDNAGSNLVTSEGHSRLAFQAVALEEPISVPPSVDPEGAFARFLPGVAGLVTNVSDAITSAADGGVKKFIRSNPNRYSVFNLLSTAPQSIGEDGSISFSGGPQLAVQDLRKVATTMGSTFDDDSPSNIKIGKHDPNTGALLQRYSTLSYTQLGKQVNKYIRNGSFDPETGTQFKNISTPKENNDLDILGRDESDALLDLVDKRDKKNKIVHHIGDYRPQPTLIQEDMKILGPIKGNYQSDNVDRINILPIIDSGLDEAVPQIITDNPDFIKFMFKDVVNNKYLVFRAILENVSDTISPNFNEEKYIGRPDKLYTYSGTERNISFSFKIYPKTKQELPVLMEKLNYLVGMCYPSYTQTDRMVTPFMELTLGDMFNKAPGLLNGLTVTVEESSTWEIDEGLQFPHFISCACEFKYIGGRENIPVSLGKHYDIPWLKGDNRIGDVGAPIGTFQTVSENDATLKKQPQRSDDFNYINSVAGS